MNLSPEDQLRLNVLLAQNVTAIRIDESAMTVHAWSAAGEARVPLNPNARPGAYLKLVRELLSTHALGSPGGYPVFLQRWTRMGQHREGQLDKLLLLGEPEAVVAVAGAPGLTPELARRVWWLMPEPDIARRMLERAAVVGSDIGREIANYLVEHLAFEEDPLTVVTTIRLILQPGLIGAETVQRIWTRAAQRNSYYKLGFLEARPDDLPGRDQAAAMALPGALLALAGAGNPLARQLQRIAAPAGQVCLATMEELLQQPTDKFIAAALFNNIGRYFAGVRLHTAGPAVAEAWLGAPEMVPLTDPFVRDVLEAAPAWLPVAAAVLALAQVDESLATPILAQTTASGTLLRRKLGPVTRLILPALATLRRLPGAPAA
jgi:hypothetical protein